MFCLVAVVLRLKHQHTAVDVHLSIGKQASGRFNVVGRSQHQQPAWDGALLIGRLVNICPPRSAQRLHLLHVLGVHELDGHFLVILIFHQLDATQNLVVVAAITQAVE